MRALTPLPNRRTRCLTIPRPAALFERLRREIDRLCKENKDLRKKASKDKERIAELEKKTDLVKKLEKELADRDKKIDDLERQLAGRKKDSSNSSKPPSSDGPEGNSQSVWTEVDGFAGISDCRLPYAQTEDGRAVGKCPCHSDQSWQHAESSGRSQQCSAHQPSGTRTAASQ